MTYCEKQKGQQNDVINNLINFLFFFIAIFLHCDSVWTGLAGSYRTGLGWTGLAGAYRTGLDWTGLNSIVKFGRNIYKE